MIREAARCGVDAVKFQKRDSASLFTAAGRAAPYTGANSFGRTYGEHRDALELDIEALARAKALAEELGLVFFASAWDAVSLGQLAALNVELLKICSADLVSLPLLRQAGALGMARQIEAHTFHGFEAFTVSTAIYLVLSLLISGGVTLYNRRVLRLPAH